MDIDELVVKLVLDPRGIQLGTKQAEDILRKFRTATKTTADDIEAQAGKMVQGFSRVTKELLGLGAVILGLGGLKDLISGTVGAAAGTGNAATAFGLNEEMLNRWQGAMKHFGIEANTTAGAIGGVAKSIADLKYKGGGDLLKGSIALAQLGITKPSSDPFALLLQISDKMATDPRRNEPGFMKMVAGEFPSIDPLLVGLMSTRLREFLDTSQTASRVQIQAAKDVAAAFVDLENAADRAKNKLLEIVAPTAEAAAKGMASVIDNIVSGDPHTPLPLFGIEKTGFSGFGGFMRNWVRLMGEAEGGAAFPQTFVDRFGEWSSGPPRRYVPMNPERRPLPSDGDKVVDRYPGLNTFRSPAAAMAAAGVGFQRTSDNINITANVNVTTPPGADPRTFGGLVATSLKQALPSIVGATR